MSGMQRFCLAPVDLAELSREVTGRGGSLEVEVHGHSMLPSIADGERVRLGPLGQAGPRPGQVLLVCQDGRACLHRYLGQTAGPRGPWLLLAGDNQTGPPERLEPEAAVARVVAVHRGVRLLLQPRRLLRLLLRGILGINPCVRARI